MDKINRIPRTAAATDEESSEQLGYETPRSGVATPRPDLHDKRLPGIATNYGQVGPASSIQVQVSTAHSHPESALEVDAKAASDACQTQSQNSEPQASLPTETLASLLDDSGPQSTKSQKAASQPQPLPSPPPSQRSSCGPFDPGVSVDAGGLKPAPSAARRFLVSHAGTDGRSLPSTPTSPPSNATPLTSVVTAQAVAPSYPSFHESARGGALPSPSLTSTCTTSLQSSQTAPPTPTHSRASSAMSGLRGWFSFDSVRMLTKAFKSGPTTPTRALSAAQPSQADYKNGSISSGLDVSRSQTPKLPTGAQAPAAKGRLTIKITEARSIKKSRDPYVVAVFQRSELISGGPRPEENDEETPPVPAFPVIGGLPIQRQGSDSGRIPMAIPMRSRQSSNTSVTDYTTFRNRNSRRSFANPKWDAEAVFDVVDSDLLVDISVYDHGSTGENFLGHVDFQASLDPDKPVSGWFQLQGHADTDAENAPTGEVYVEASYQKSERKHLGPEDFQILRLIGRGTFGQVYQVRKKDTERIYAMKVLSKKVIVQKKEVAHTVGERNILVRTATSDSPFIVGLKFSFQTPSDLYLVTDYMSGGELFWHLQKEGRFDEKRAKFYIAELILAIQHLHQNDIVYRDLKPENILLDANGHIALCDFGLSKANLTKNDTTNTFCGTTEYLAPEVLLDESGYTKMVDFWSLGVLVFEMCCGWSPFYADDTQQMYKNIAFGKVKFPQRALSQDGKNFVKGLLNRNPRHRLGAIDDAEELKRHPFFSDIDWDLLAKKLITPPFKPKLKSETDVSYFDPEFTNALDNSGSLHERAAALARGFATSTPLSPSVQANFQGFTYVDESALEENMRDRYDDEDMSDAHHESRRDEDDDWDNLDDMDLRRGGNRMSGIVRTNNTDEHMLGHFED
ncbi:hypothetical protein jhhlp_007244 [Lomentospora prolificans]|uniref:non-specific serine/threonine protein kinase n=1 Tax=Lomentospora prolificans TaxID=41688 RepID=A0A2N3N235_9PEZI|nr:hypothetical protein jhhlp_007244 [Lomentospora prolificans]